MPLAWYIVAIILLFNIDSSDEKSEINVALFRSTSFPSVTIGNIVAGKVLELVICWNTGELLLMAKLVIDGCYFFFLLQEKCMKLVECFVNL